MGRSFCFEERAVAGCKFWLANNLERLAAKLGVLDCGGVGFFLLLVFGKGVWMAGNLDEQGRKICNDYF